MRRACLRVIICTICGHCEGQQREMRRMICIEELQELNGGSPTRNEDEGEGKR
jgi:hypothetical protein